MENKKLSKKVNIRKKYAEKESKESYSFFAKAESADLSRVEAKGQALLEELSSVEVKDFKEEFDSLEAKKKALKEEFDSYFAKEKAFKELRV
jgi:hypothetical protein